MTNPYDQIVPDNLARARDRIADAAAKAGRKPETIRLIAVSKNHPIEAVHAAMQAGQTHFGENRIQEAATKFTDLRQAAPAPFLHIIGPIQTNKLRDALAVADSIDTLDRFRLLEALERHFRAHPTEKGPRLLLQVNVDDEPQKAGIARNDVDAFLADCQARIGNRVQGLMCIPAARQDPTPSFAWLADCAAKHGLPILSMGMSGDYEAAIACGATEIRIGTALFGTREVGARENDA